METIEMTVLDLYVIRNYLMGVDVLKGFLNEDGLSEGIKRRATKLLRTVLHECEPINLRLDELRKDKDKEKEDELLKDLVKITIEKLDFNKIENVSLSCDYQFLYDKVFINA